MIFGAMPSPEGLGLGEASDPVASLSACERGLLAGVFLGHGGRTDFEALDGVALEARLAGLAEPVRARLASVAGWLRERERDQRAGRLARVMRGLVAPLPPGLALIHSDWVEDALLAASPAWWPWLLPALPAIHRPVLERLMTERAASQEANPGSEEASSSLSRAAETLEPETVAAVVRGVFAVLAPMEQGDGNLEAEAWLAIETGRFDDEVLALGATVLGHSLSGAERPLLERAAAPFGEPWSSRIHAAAEAEVEASARATARACLVALPPMSSARATLLAIGATALGFRLREEPTLVRRRLAQRLPRSAGERLLRVSEAALDPTTSVGSQW